MAAFANATPTVRSEAIFGFVIGRSDSMIWRVSRARSATTSGIRVAFFVAALDFGLRFGMLFRFLEGRHYFVE